MKIHFLPDKPIHSRVSDTLGVGEFVDLIQESIYYTDPPFVYGLLGDWGTGKTSILQLLKNRLANKRTNQNLFVPIWFNAWEYENEANLIYPLLYAIKRDYERVFEHKSKTEAFGQKFLKVVATSTLALTDVGLRVATKHLTGEAVKLDDVAKQLKAVQEQPDALESILGNWANQVEQIKESFEELLITYAQSLLNIYPEIQVNQIRFVILIDDLDRCLPDTSITLLESIKNFLTVKNCIFILGLNPNIVYQGIRLKYQGLDINGREYLEKILNYSFHVPNPKPQKVVQFSQESIEKLIEYDQNETDLQSTNKTYFEELGQVFSECHFNNPRKIKRILNRYLFFIKKHATDQYRNTNIVRLIILAEYFPQLFQLLLTDAESTWLELVEIGTSSFDIDKFEQKYGIAISNTYYKLSKMNTLFKFVLPTSDKLPSLSNEVLAVFDITRIL